MMEKIIWTYCVRNEEVLHTVKKDRNYTIKPRKANWIGHMWLRNCLPKHVTEGKTEGRIEVIGRREIRLKQLLHDLKQMKRYWYLKEEGLNRTVWRTRFGSGYVPVVRETA
jgi:hypothetical protein